MGTRIPYSGMVSGATLAFDPAADDWLLFDDPAVSAASLLLAYESDFTGVTFRVAGGIFALPPAVSLLSLYAFNVQFVDGSMLLVGDDSLAADDHLANTLNATRRHDQLLGLAGADTLAGAAGDDRLDGGAGADLLRGGLGADTYVVDDALDVVDETPTTDPLRVSARADDTPAATAATGAAFSPDGRYVAFHSDASNLVDGDTNAVFDVFVKDLHSAALQRVSTGAAGGQGNATSLGSRFSADGRQLVFHSVATNLVALDTNNTYDVFIKDLDSGALRLVSTTSTGAQGNGQSNDGSLSADGRYVVFESVASNLVPGDTNASTGVFVKDVFVKDLQSGAIQRVSTSAAGAEANGSSLRAQFSADGRHVLFESNASNLVAGDTNGTFDIFVKDWQGGAIQRVSTGGAGTQGNGSSVRAQFSADGRYVVFESTASDLVEGDTNRAADIFLKDLQSGAIQRVSTGAGGTEANARSLDASLSADGRFVAFQSDASNLVAGDTNGVTDIFIKDLQDGALRRVSTNTAGDDANGASTAAEISADGRHLVFQSVAGNLVDDFQRALATVYEVANPFFADDAVDSVRAGVSYVLPQAVEQLALTGSGAIDATGNALDNLLLGNDAANTLAGREGQDTLTGGGGDDTFVLAASGAGVDTITDFSAADVLRVAALLSTAEVTAGDGSGLEGRCVQALASGGFTMLSFDTDGLAGTDLQVRLQGEFLPAGFRVAVAQGGASNVSYIAPPPGADLDGMVYHWNSHVLLGGVSVELGAGAGSALTASDGRFHFEALPVGSHALAATRGTADSGAVTSADALAALRLAVGLNPNADPDGNGPLQAAKVSPFQVIAADVNEDGRVTSADALAILRMAAKAPGAAAAKWLFVSEALDLWDEVAQGSALTRTDAQWNTSLTLELQQDTTANLLGVLRGDVNGSWAAPPGSLDLDASEPAYFTALASRLGMPLDMWGA